MSAISYDAGVALSVSSFLFCVFSNMRRRLMSPRNYSELFVAEHILRPRKEFCSFLVKVTSV